MNIFQDESGCLGFEAASSKFFIITLLCPDNSKHLSNVIRKFKGDIIKAGWPKDIEIKANHLHMAKYNNNIPIQYKYKNTPDEPIIKILKKMASMSIEIDAIVVNKAKISGDLKTLPYGVLYNYYSKNVLVERIIKYDDAKLFIDRTSKQTHKMKHFDDYIYTEALLAKGHNFNFSIEHGDSNVIRGITAVDFISWGLSRRHEYNDPGFWQLFKHRILTYKQFYF
jgi:hypothetical protein